MLDLAAHDGRWSHALAQAGAREVIGIEARPELIAYLDDMPPNPRISLRQEDIFDALAQMKAKKEHFDVVALFGILYHIMDHFALLKGVIALRPKLILVDSEFISIDRPMIQLLREHTDQPLNATAQYEGQEVTAVGIPSMGAMELMTSVLNYDCEWLNWDRLPLQDRQGLQDYFRADKKRRRSCALRPM